MFQNMLYSIMAIILSLIIGENVAFKVNGTQDRIHNSMPAVNGQFPYMVLILIGLFQPNDTQLSSCSGSLIGLDTILTAANCVKEMKPSMVVVMAGKADATKYVFHRINNPFKVKFKSAIVQESIASKFHFHPNSHHSYDMAIIKIAKPFVRTQYVNTIPFTLDEYPLHTLCTLSGYGFNGISSPDFIGYLTFFQTSHVENDLQKCGILQPYTDYLCIVHNTGTSEMACQGDSGAPLVCKDRIYGVYVSNHYYYSFWDICGARGSMNILRLSQSEKRSQFLSLYSYGLFSKSYQLLPQCYVFVTVLLLFWL